ncbi:MAG: hypothetical protein COT59_00620 [Candidatus Nealsonbacteria bacterium CG09_land_8_20_14_0_10_42_14]|uniref:Uncharacterized protein n=1 Tax=Candidatus Nealsonbacteria bacterium CG09_land_8_20_14_0_10_42_14 TaxID=1974707 RepID=A0A2H0WXV5_9BACT|nr:MAG: hypothetical protein COT59_00620 [Candidatus Nealsonbacteria bacterium CG09_land_8_20_14_0_10_42_14]
MVIFISILFYHKLNNLSKGLKTDKKKVEKWLLRNKIRPTQRAETLSIDDWLNLTKDFKT